MSNQPNIITDLSTLTHIPNKTLAELSHKITLCIGSIIAEAKLKGESAVLINIGIGTLSIDLIKRLGFYVLFYRYYQSQP